MSLATNDPAPEAAAAGTVYLQTKPPAAVVVMVAPAVPEVQLATVMATPLYASVTPEVPANPVAVTVTLLPTIPLVGAKGEIVQAVTVYGEK